MSSGEISPPEQQSHPLDLTPELFTNCTGRLTFVLGFCFIFLCFISALLSLEREEIVRFFHFGFPVLCSTSVT